MTSPYEIYVSSLESQHKRGKLHAVERLSLLFDDGKMDDLLPDEERDGVFASTGKVCGKQVVATSQDFTYKGGSLGKLQGQNIVKAIDYAVSRHCPIVFINDSGGARVQEGIDALAGYGEVFNRQVQISGVIPQLSVIAGPCAGGASYMPALTDFVFSINNTGKMFLTGPSIVEEVTGEKVDMETLGGASMHAVQSGVVHFYEETEQSCFTDVRNLLQLLPRHTDEKGAYDRYSFLAPRKNQKTFALPESKRKPYPIMDIIESVVDPSSFLEVHERFARQVIVGFARIAGICVGIVANRTAYMAGSLDCDSSDKAARFIRFCDCMRIPLVSLTDVPGFLPGREQEARGVIRHGAKLIYAFAEASVPKINVILRNAYGGAYIAMNSIHLQADAVFSWEDASIAVMGERGAVNLLYGKQAAALPESDRQAFIQSKIDMYCNTISPCTVAYEKQYVQKIISPLDTRKEILKALLAYRNKPYRGRHGNIPL